MEISEKKEDIVLQNVQQLIDNKNDEIKELKTSNAYLKEELERLKIQNAYLKEEIERLKIQNVYLPSYTQCLAAGGTFVLNIFGTQNIWNYASLGLVLSMVMKCCYKRK